MEEERCIRMSIIGKLKNAWYKRNTDSYVPYLRSIGMRIGEGTIIFASPRSVFIDSTRPWLIEIGNDVQITSGVKILTHGYDWSVIKGKYGEVLGSAGKVTIGNNCFIGMNSIILKGTTIGDNVVIGAGSVVGGVIPSNSVAVGNPCKVKYSIDEYREKRQHAQIREAKELVLEYYRVYGKRPEPEVLAEFFWLFEDRTEQINHSFKQKMQCVRNYDDSMSCFLTSEKAFDNYDSFLEYCFMEEPKEN